MKQLKYIPLFLCAFVAAPASYAQTSKIAPDTNFNGIRDDLDSLIKGKPGLTPGQRNSMAQMALVAQKILNRDPSKDASELVFELNQAEACLFAHFSNKNEERSKVYGELKSTLLNTPERIKRYEKVGELPGYKPENSYVQIDKARCTYSHY